MADPDEPTRRLATPPEGLGDKLINSLIAGKYQVKERIARGGMAAIYRAVQQPLGREVALKVLTRPHEGTEHDPRFQERFFLEAATLAKLSHPNLVTVYDYGYFDDHDRYYIVMEFVRGRTLGQMLRDDGPMPAARMLGLALEICRALQAAHAQGIVHRDLKPGNVMVTDTVDGEHLKVLDFGIAKVLHSEQSNITMDDRILGSPRYMAPEQIRQGDVGPATDVYSLGVMMFQMITGRPPYGGSKGVETLVAHINDPIPSIRDYCGERELIEEVDALIHECLQKDPADRPRDASELKRRIRGVLLDQVESTTASNRLDTESVARRARGVGVSDHPTLDQNGTLRERRGGGWIPIALFGAVVLLLLLLGGPAIYWFGLRSSAPEPEPGAQPSVAATPEPEPPAAPEEPQATSAKLTVHSEPPGAELWEGNRLHGVTPLVLDISASGEARPFELRHEGHVSKAWSQEPIADDREVRLVLEATPKPAPRPRPRPAPRPRPKPSDLDILDER